jgi:hypothetical protein
MPFSTPCARPGNGRSRRRPDICQRPAREHLTAGSRQRVAPAFINASVTPAYGMRTRDSRCGRSFMRDIEPKEHGDDEDNCFGSAGSGSARRSGPRSQRRRLRGWSLQGGMRRSAWRGRRSSRLWPTTAQLSCGRDMACTATIGTAVASAPDAAHIGQVSTGDWRLTPSFGERPLFAHAAEGGSRRIAEVADRNLGRRKWAESDTTAATSGTTAVRAIDAVPLRARNRLQRLSRHQLNIRRTIAMFSG